MKNEPFCNHNIFAQYDLVAIFWLAIVPEMINGGVDAVVAGLVVLLPLRHHLPDRLLAQHVAQLEEPAISLVLFTTCLSWDICAWGVTFLH